MHHPFSTHKNSSIVIICGQNFTARLKMFSQYFAVQISVRKNGRKIIHVDYAEDHISNSDSQKFNYAYWTLKAVLNFFECEAAREVVHPDWLVLKQPFSMKTLGAWPSCKMKNLSINTNSMEQDSDLYRGPILPIVQSKSNVVTMQIAE